SRSRAEMTWMYFKNLVDTLEPVNLVLLIIGLAVGGRLLLQRDKLVLLSLSLAMLLGVWIRLSASGDMNGRYFYTLTLLLVPWEAIGLIALVRWMGRRSPQAARRAALLTMITLVALFWTDALTSQHPRRDAHARLGRWMRRELGPLRSVVVDRSSCRVGYFAQETIPQIGAEDRPMRTLLAEETPELVILSVKNNPSYQSPELIAWLESQGLMRLDTADLPYDREEFIVLTRRLPRSLSAARRQQLAAQRADALRQ
ncbi:MAG: hypothetical protein ACREIV_03020, partial [Planctomycetaceae bacterium]